MVVSLMDLRVESGDSNGHWDDWGDVERSERLREENFGNHDCGIL